MRPNESKAIATRSPLDEARTDLATVQERLYALAATARACGVLNDEGVLRLRTVMKSGAVAKVTSVGRADEVQRESEAFEAELRQLVDSATVSNGHVAAGSGSNDRQAAKADETPSRVDADVALAPADTTLCSVEAVPDVDTPSPAPARRGRPRSTTHGPRRRALAELSADEVAEMATRRTLVTAMQQGSTAAEALRLIGRKDSQAARRWAQRVYQRYVRDGQLYDRRHAPAKRESKVMTTAIAATAELLWLHNRGAAASAIRHRIRDMVKELAAQQRAGKDISYHPLGQAMLQGSVEIPSVPTLYRFFESLGPDKAKIRQVGFSEWIRQTRTITKEEPWALHANERWEIDHSLLDTHIKTESADGLWVQARPWLTAIIDVYSRAIMAIVLSLRAPDAFTTAIVLRRAILPKADWPEWTARGLPRLLVLDNGRDFRSSDVATSLSALGIRQEFCAPHMPDQKPHIERFFGTLTRNLLPMLPGYVDGSDRGEAWSDKRIGRLLTVPQLRAYVERWIVEFYHKEVHQSTMRRPAELWEESVPGVSVPPREDLDALLLQTDERLVSRGFIRFSPPTSGRKRVYYAPVLLGANGRRVQLRYNPDDLASVMVYDALTRERIGEAWDVHSASSPYTKSAIRQQARDFRARLGAEVKPLIERGEAYHDHIAVHDRVGTKRSVAAEQEAQAIQAEADAAIAEAESTLAALGGQTTEQRTAEDEDEMVREMKERLRASARARTSSPLVTVTADTLPLDPTHGSARIERQALPMARLA